MSIPWFRRILTVAIGIPLSLLMLNYDISSLFLLSCLHFVALMEYNRNLCVPLMTKLKIKKSSVEQNSLLLPILGAIVCSLGAFHSRFAFDFSFFISFLILCFSRLYWASQQTMHLDFIALGLDVFGMLYIVWGFSHALLLRQATSYGKGFQILGALCMFNTDNGALIIGRLAGNQKLLPHISPNKTLAGAVGGVSWSILTVLGLCRLSSSDILPFDLLLLPPLTTQQQIAIGFVLGILAIYGDLLESFAKRSAGWWVVVFFLCLLLKMAFLGIKDSGTFFPGHGGCLDRLDSMMFVSVFLYYYTSYYY